jgi:DNA-binding transcriptional LysR family regulator
MTAPRSSQQPTLRQLRAFEAVARHRSFRRAAEELALSQPALSAAVRDFEALLGGLLLLERSTHRVALTEAGAGVLPQVQWLLNSFTLGVQDLQRSLQGQAQRLRIAALPSAMHHLAPALAAWQALHPRVELAVRDMLQDELPAGHALAGRASLRWADLRHEKLALFARGSNYDFALAQLRQRGIGLQQASLLAYSESLYSLVRSGLAVGVIFRLYTHGLQDDGGLAVRPLRAPAITRRIALLAHRHALALSPVVAQCRQHLVAALAGTLGSA